MKIYRKIHFPLLSLIFGICQSVLLAQESSPLFEPLPPGLPNNSVRCILRDSKGYMWFGTSEGLARFDGVNFRIYENDPDDPNSIDHNSVNAILEDDQKNLLVGTSAGLNVYSREKDHFIHIRITDKNNKAKKEYVSSLCTDNNGTIWIGTVGTGVLLYDPVKQAFQYFSHNSSDVNSISSNDVTRIGKDPDNNIWVGTRNGLNLFSEKQKNFRRFFNKPGNGMKKCSSHVTSFASDTKGNFWVGTRGGGLNKITRKNNAFVFEHYANDRNDPVSLSNNIILSLCNDRNGYLWIGTENGGLNRLNLADNTITKYYNEESNPYSISGNSIWSLYTDEEGILWIGIYGKGINIVNHKNRKFSVYQRNTFDKTTLVDNHVRAFAEDREGNIWIATDGGGLCRFDPVTRQFTKTINNTNGLRTNAVMALLCDSKKDLWIGTWSGGVDHLNKTGTKIKNYRIGDPETNINVVSLYEDRHGNIWVGSASSGLFLYNKGEDKFVQFISDNTAVPSPRSYITSFAEDRHGVLWVGTLYGLFALTRKDDNSYTGETFYHEDKTGSISSNAIEVIYCDSKDKLWFGTGDKGLNLLNDNGTFTLFQKKNGLPGNAIRTIVEDKKGNLWISTNKGLSRFDPTSGKFRNFAREDGLNSNEFYPRSGIQTHAGEFYFGGKSGFNTFYPDSVVDNTFVPPVYLTDIRINGKPVQIGAKDSPLQKHISVTPAITLTHEQTSFAIDFAALNFTQASRNKYAYKLEGFDNEWNYVDNRSSATYTNIDPGQYTFMVRGSNNDEVWNETPALLVLTINPPIWKTWWAILSYFVIMSSLILVFQRIRWERRQVKNQLKLERMAREKEHELSQLKMQFFTNISHEFRTPLSLIIAPLESLISSSDHNIRQQLSITYRNACKLMRLVNDLMNFRKLDEGKIKLNMEQVEIVEFISTIAGSFTELSKSRNITFTVEPRIRDCKGWIDKDKIETIISNLLGNAFKFVKDNGSVSVTVALKEEVSPVNRINPNSSRLLELVVVDNGIGINPEELPLIFEKFYQAKSAHVGKTSGTGIGLALVKGLVELHHGTITVQSIPNQETRFTILVPIERKVYHEGELSPVQTVLAEPGMSYEPENEQEDEQAVNNPEKAHILVVEDNVELRNYLVTELEKKFIVSQAVDGREGIDKVLNKMPDLIVSDIVMPGKSGIDLCRELKSDIRVSHIPIILLTARTTIEDQIEGLDTGADAYLSKPFNVRLLQTQIKQLIESRRKLYTMFSQSVYMMPAKMAENELDRVFLQKAIDYIIHHMTDSQLNVEALADVFNMSRSQVYRKIKALTGKTAVEFVRIVRLKQALKLMEMKKYTLSEIAYQTGFTSPSYFTKSFKEQYGKAPSEFLEPNGRCQVHNV